MKISASIYSDNSRPLKAVIADLEAHQVDLLHIDCNDNVSVFDDIKQIREWCTLPLDLHIITPDPAKFYPYLLENPVEYLTFQVEDLKAELEAEYGAIDINLATGEYTEVKKDESNLKKA